MKKQLFAFAFLFISITAIAEIADSNFIEFKNIGVSIIKPSSWYLVTPNDIKLSRDRLKIFQNMKNEYDSTNPNFIDVGIMKYKEPYLGINPNVEFVVRPLHFSTQIVGNKTILKANILNFKKRFDDLVLISNIKDTKIFGHKAATTVMKFSLEMIDNNTYALVTRVIILKHKSKLYTIYKHVSDNPSNEDIEEMKKIFESIKIN